MEVLNLPLLTLFRLLESPPDLLLEALLELVAAVDEVERSVRALPARSPAAERPTETI